MIEMKENAMQESINALREVLDTPKTVASVDVDFAQVTAYVQEKRKLNTGWGNISNVYNPDNTKHRMGDINKLTFTVNRVDEETGEVMPLDYYVNKSILQEFLPANVNIRQIILDGQVKWKGFVRHLNSAGLKMIPTKSKDDRMYCTIVDPASIERDTISVKVYHNGEHLWKTIKVAHALERLEKKANQRNNMQTIK